MYKVLYIRAHGPLLEFQRYPRQSGGALTVINHDPWVETGWQMSRGELLRLAWRAFCAAVF